MEFLWKSAIVIGLFYIVYRLFLEQETFFNAIRAYLLGGIILSVILPFVVIRKYVTIAAQGPYVISDPVGSETVAMYSGPDIGQVLMLIYLAGALFFLVRFLIQLTTLGLFLWRSPKKREGKYRLIPTRKKTSPFSFFHFIVYPHGRFTEPELDQIMAHEKAHANGLHSIDVLLTQLLCVLQWFNPLAWLYSKEVSKNLEYIADASVKDLSVKKENYAYLLLKTSVNEYALALALTSNFFNSMIKKRIKMLQKNKSSNAMYLKFTLIAPLLAAFVLTFNTEVIAQAKKVEKVVVEKEIRVEVIDKNAQKKDLDAMKASWAKEGVTLNYKKLKYNDKNEIIGIELDVSSNKGSKANLSLSGTEPIQPIAIRFDKNSGSISLGNVQSMGWDMEIHEEHGPHKKIVVNSDGDKEVIMIKGGKDGTWHTDDENVFIIKGDKDGEVNWTSDEDVTVKVIGGDSTMVSKKIKVIKLKEGDDVEEIMIEKVKEGDGEMKVIVKTLDKDDAHDHEMIFMDEGNASLVIIDGKESTHEELKKLWPDEIETINVWKGDKAVEKYGDKAKDGVIDVKTKK
jgi:beta-lactamase regulating signal transducer with metallopeptidase domain